MSGPESCSECAGCGWVPYPTETKDGCEEWAWKLCGGEHEGPGAPLPERPEVRDDLWRVVKVFDYGPEDNLRAWEQAAAFLEGLGHYAERQENEALIVALEDARKRANEEVRRAQVEAKMRREWAERQPTRAEPM